MTGEAARYAEVAVAVPVRRTFTYRVPAGIAGDLVAGARVAVPLGRRRAEGTVVGWPADPPPADVAVKDIRAAVPGQPPLPAELLELTRFVADYYLCSWGEAIEAALPPRLRGTGGVLVAGRRPGVVPDDVPARATARRRILAALPADGSPLPVAVLGRGAARVVRDLAAAGLVVLERRVADDLHEPEPTAPLEGPEPTAEQRAVLEPLAAALDAGVYAPFLLHGVTGSGKTEVYLRAARRALDRGRSVLYLVPEIGLTPLLAARIAARFPGQAVTMHSALPAGARARAWRRVHDGERRLVVGTRSAVFAPLADLGLIVVDEEHDGSYKQQETPRYHGRDLAVVRARLAGATLVLGSATPSMESYAHARSGRYRLVRLPGRILDRPLATVVTVDMRDEYRTSGVVSPLSNTLVVALRECVERGEQALVLRNRRGWSVALLCPSCGIRAECDRCSVSLTWHRGVGRLRCHYCAAEHPFPSACSTCGAPGDTLRLVGEGTEQLEDLLRAALPGARIERMDRDSIRRRGEHERLLRRFERAEIDVLVGTQMIAKGHDFPNVTVVGVISADQALGLPDFRAGERTFQLLTQVAGRAGRGERPGVVVVQAFDPTHPVLRLAARQDYEAFFERELRYRRALRFPPLAALVQVVVRDRDLDRARAWSEEVAEGIRAAGDDKMLVSGPGPAPIERVQGRWRRQILARTAGRRRLVQAVDRALAGLAGRVPSRALTVDVDPLALL